MKENKYDDAVFFNKYSEMTRSKSGLDGAGEWETLKPLLPDFKDKRVLDLGCGYGWHCVYAAQKGAKEVTGVDISKSMLEIAAEKSRDYPNIRYICEPIEDVVFPDKSFDIVLSSLAFHYVKSFTDIAAKINKVLNIGGEFIFSAEHPVFTAQGPQNWYYDKDGSIKHFPVDNYFYEGERIAEFLGEKVIKYHKTLTTYVNGLLENGFNLTHLVEPQPPKSLLPQLQNEMRRPMMIIICAVKK